MAPCSLCQDLQKKNGAARLALDFKPHELQTSISKTGCVSCSLILEGIRCFENNMWSFEKHVAHVYGYGLATNQDTFSIQVYFIDDRPKLIIEYFYSQYDPHARSWQAIKPVSLTNGNPLGPQSMSWVNSLLIECLHHHEDCPSMGEERLPFRILALEAPLVGHPIVRLEENETKYGRYATLSHRWGSQQSCTTTLSTLKIRQLDIPWNEIPKTFQDSIIYCLSLNIYYLWIDALCIIQDSESDWEIESSKMANIYQNSYITLAAAAAANDSEGCFMQTQISSKEFKLTASEAYQPIFVRRKLDHWIIPPTEASMQQAPLLTRGWVFQERILSPRVLYFCRQELLWECECMITCECGSESQLPSTKLDLDPEFESIRDNILKHPRGKPSLHRRAVRLMYPHLFPNEQSLPEDRYLDESDSDYSEDETTSANLATQEDHNLTFDNWILTMKFSEKWHRNVERYSALKLTKPSDYLPALSGLAQLTSSSLKLYAAGLWTDTISADLLWRVDKLQLDSGRPLETRGPSWSWVSVTSRVNYWTMEEAINYTKELISSDSVGTSFDRSGRVHVQHHPQPMPARPLNNISCTTEAKGENRFGEVHAGELSLTGYLQEVTLEYVFDSVYIEGQNWPKMQLNPLKYELRINIPALGELSVPFYADYILRNSAAGQVPDHTQLSLLQIFPGTCLVLKPAGQDSVFERIGVFQAHAAFGSMYHADVMERAKECRITII